MVRESPPAAWWQACGTNFRTACRFSLAPFGEPGSVTINVLLRTPATGLDITATALEGISACENIKYY